MKNMKVEAFHFVFIFCFAVKNVLLECQNNEIPNGKTCKIIITTV